MESSHIDLIFVYYMDPYYQHNNFRVSLSLSLSLSLSPPPSLPYIHPDFVTSATLSTFLSFSLLLVYSTFALKSLATSGPPSGNSASKF